MTRPTRTLGIYVYDRVEVLDFAGPFEVFTKASAIASDPKPFEVVVLSEDGGPVTTTGGLRVLADHGIGAHPPLDVLLVPGGWHRDEMGKPAVMDWLARTHEATELTASVCTGAFLLAQAGVLTDHEVTTHWDDVTDLRAEFPRLTVRHDVRWVHRDGVATSAGISAGLDLALHLVAELHSRALADETARRMDYRWADRP